MYNEISMYSKTKVLACSVVLLSLCLLAPAYSIPQASAQFVINTGPVSTFDEYGQGIEFISFYENSTGAWVVAPWYTHYYPDYHEELGTFYSLPYYQTNYFLNWTAGVGMKIRVTPAVNTTLIGTVDPDIAKNLVRHNITVTNNQGDIIFSQQNFTYVDDFYFECVLNFLPQMGEIYLLTILQEIYY